MELELDRGRGARLTTPGVSALSSSSLIPIVLARPPFGGPQVVTIGTRVRRVPLDQVREEATFLNPRMPSTLPRPSSSGGILLKGILGAAVSGGNGWAGRQAGPISVALAFAGP